MLSAFKKSECAVLIDDSSDRSRSVLVAPARDVTPELLNRLISISRGGLVFVAITRTRAQAFMLSPMSRPRMKPGSEEDPKLLPLLESVEAREGVTTGISAADRARTVNVLGEDSPAPRKLVKPGHIFPIEVRDGGVLVRNALPEGAVDLTMLAGYTDAAVCIDLLDDKGDYLAEEATRALARSEGFPAINLSELIDLRLHREQLVFRVAEAKLPTRVAGEMRSYIYKCRIHSGEHIALVKGEIDPEQPTLTRVHAEFTFGDVFGGTNPPSRVMVQGALEAIGRRGSGVLLYLRRPWAGQLKEQVSAWQNKFQEKSMMMAREYGLGAQILRDLGVRKVELLTQSNTDLLGLNTFGIEIVRRVPIPAVVNE